MQVTGSSDKIGVDDSKELDKGTREMKTTYHRGVQMDESLLAGPVGDADRRQRTLIMDWLSAVCSQLLLNEKCKSTLHKGSGNSDPGKRGYWKKSG